MIKDPYNQTQKWDNWKGNLKEGIPNISKENSDILLKYLSDMELGLNVNRKSIKGSRSKGRLNSIRSKMLMIMKTTEKDYNLKSITNVTENIIFDLFNAMRKGGILNQKGETYRSTGDYVKTFRAFWNWYRKVNRKNGKEIKDITEDLDSRTDEKPKWVYLNEEQMKELLENVLYKHRVLFSFLYDSGVRSPSELINIKVGDFTDDFRKLNIREETSKTFGRKIKIMFSREIIKKYVKKKKLKKEDYIFPISPMVVNLYLQRNMKKIFGEVESEAGELYSKMTLYDFRHISCCFWLPRYKSESSLKYRFGWKKSERIHYYSEFLGMKDTIAEEDLLSDITLSEVERRLNKSEDEKEILKEVLTTEGKRIDYLEKSMKVILEMVKDQYERKGIGGNV